MKSRKWKIAGAFLGGILVLTGFSPRTVTVVETTVPVAVATTGGASTTAAKMAAAEIQNVKFEFDKATIRPEFFEELDRIAKLVVDNKASLKIGGHADNIGEYVYNWKLSKSRADTVKAYLVSKGVQASRIAATEYGDTVPLASNDSEEGREQNRRVEFELN